MREKNIAKRVIMGSKKRPFGAWWLSSSFTRNITNDDDFTFYVGCHKPRQQGTKNMRTVRNDPDAFYPKMDITVSRLYDTHKKSKGSESFPIYAKSSPSLVAGIEVLNPRNGRLKTFSDISDKMVSLWLNRDDIEYFIFNPNEKDAEEIVQITKEKGITLKYEKDSPMSRKEDIRWVKGSHVYIERPLRDNEDKKIRQLLIIGKDIRYDEVVLGMKKTWKDYSMIVPLHKRGLSFVTALKYMILNRPDTRYPLIAMETFNNKLIEKIREIKNFELVYCPIESSFNTFTKKLEIR